MQSFTSFTRSLNKKKLLILVGSLIAAGVITLSAHALNASAPGPQPAGEAEATEVLLLTLRPTGFEPSEVNVPAGRYLLVVNNRTGLEQFTPRLERDGQGAVHEVRALRRRRNWKHPFRLTPGRYVLTESNNTGWVCRITVTP
jgi:hypothetical protein